MKLASYRAHGRESFGAVIGDGAGEGVVDLHTRLKPRFTSVLDLLRLQGGLDAARETVRGVRADFPLSEVELLPPLRAPEKILCIGINYANRNADYGDVEVPKYPSMFYRAPGSLVGHGQNIVRPRESEQLDYEGEIALVIGRTGRRIAQDDALAHVAGITLCNEGTIRDWVRHAKFNVTQGKNFDSTGSLGPWLVPYTDESQIADIRLTTRVNGETRQDDRTGRLIFGFRYLINYLSTFTTLVPGDVIVTGTPTGAGARFDPPRYLKPGDVIEVEAEGVGVLKNGVADEA